MAMNNARKGRDDTARRRDVLSEEEQVSPVGVIERLDRRSRRLEMLLCCMAAYAEYWGAPTVVVIEDRLRPGR